MNWFFLSKSAAQVIPYSERSSLSREAPEARRIPNPGGQGAFWKRKTWNSEIAPKIPSLQSVPGKWIDRVFSNERMNPQIEQLRPQLFKALRQLVLAKQIASRPERAQEGQRLIDEATARAVDASSKIINSLLFSHKGSLERHLSKSLTQKPAAA